MFDDIIGNDKIKQLLINSVNSNKISHSYLFIGNSGIGKFMIAKHFSKMILCTSFDKKYCDNCKSCVEFETSNNPDFKIIRPDGNSIKIEQIREMQKKVNEKPIISDRKVYVIDNSDKMTLEAQNCLLKTLEEPPEFVTIILIGANESAFLSTIKSRCMILHFEQIVNKEIKQFLLSKYGITINSQIMLETFQGSIGRALQITEKKQQYEDIENIILNLEKKDIIDILKLSEVIYNSKDDKFEILEFINMILFNLSKKSSKYANCIDIIEDTKKRLKSNSNYDMCIDNMLFNLWETVN